MGVWLNQVWNLELNLEWILELDQDLGVEELVLAQEPVEFCFMKIQPADPSAGV